jgi:hypothetical protein
MSQEKPLSKKHKKELDHIIESLSKYFSTPEGEELFERMQTIFPQKDKALSRPALTQNEECAFRFIQRELKRGHSPSVREVTKVVELKSSRSGYRIINSLLTKGLLHRKDNHFQLPDKLSGGDNSKVMAAIIETKSRPLE